MPRGRNAEPQTEEVIAPSTPRGAKRFGKKAASVSPVRVRDPVKMAATEKDLLSTPSKSRSRSTQNTPVVSPVKSPKMNRSLIEDEVDSEEDALVTPKPSSPGKKGKKAPALITPVSEITTSFGSPKSTIAINPRVQKAYQIIRACTGTLGGNGTTGAIYGELTMGSMQRVINLMIEKCEMNDQSRFIDVGAGLGKPNFHAAQDPACRVSVGVELEKIRWQLSMFNLSYVAKETSRGRTEGEADEDVTRASKVSQP